MNFPDLKDLVDQHPLFIIKGNEFNRAFAGQVGELTIRQLNAEHSALVGRQHIVDLTPQAQGLALVILKG